MAEEIAVHVQGRDGLSRHDEEKGAGFQKCTREEKWIGLRVSGVIGSEEEKRSRRIAWATFRRLLWRSQLRGGATSSTSQGIWLPAGHTGKDFQQKNY